MHYSARLKFISFIYLQITQKNNKSLEKKKELLSEKKNFEMIEKSKSMKVEELNRIKESYEVYIFFYHTSTEN